MAAAAPITRRAPLQNNNCRMYEAVYPEVDDHVIVLVKNVAEMGAYVELLEYNNIEGMILLSELSRRRIRSINKLIRVGRTEVVVVLRVDKDKGTNGYRPQNLPQMNLQDTSTCQNGECHQKTSQRRRKNSTRANLCTVSYGMYLKPAACRWRNCTSSLRGICTRCTVRRFRATDTVRVLICNRTRL